PASLREVSQGGGSARHAEFAFQSLEPGTYVFHVRSVGGSDPVTTFTSTSTTTSTSFGSFGSFDAGVPVFEGPTVDVMAASSSDSRLENVDLRGRLRVL